MDVECDSDTVYNSDLSDELELCDLIEYEKDGVKHLAYYIGDGCFYVIENKLPLETDGYKHRFITPSEAIDIKSVIKFNDIVKCKYKIIRDKIEWRTMEDGDVNCDEHDVIEIDNGFRVRHFAICSKIGHAVDLNPKNRLYVIGWPPLSSCVRPTREGDNFGIESGEMVKFANGEIRERKIEDVIKNKKYRIRSDQILIDVNRSTKNQIYYLKPLQRDEIRDRIRRAIKQEFTQYNICLKNCEHFVMWIKYGVCICSQTQRVKDMISNLAMCTNDSTD